MPRSEKFYKCSVIGLSTLDAIELEVGTFCRELIRSHFAFSVLSVQERLDSCSVLLFPEPPRYKGPTHHRR
jgi:hypothetical protein